MSRAGPVTVGLDLGTSGLKAVAIDGGGAVQCRVRRSYPTHRPEPAAAEQDPGDWWRALDEAVRELAASAPATSWRAIGLSAMLPTLVPSTADGSPVGPAISWQDGRAEAEGDALRAVAGPDELYARTGQWVDGRYLLAMMTRLVRVDPGARRATHVVAAKDHLFARLTGELLTDPSTATGFGCYDLVAGAWSGAPGWALPELAASDTTRPLLPELARRWGVPAGTPVVLGAADSVLGAHALGVRDPGEVAYLAGTSTVVLGPLGSLRTDPAHRYLVTPLAEGGFGAEMDLLATGSAQAWWAQVLGLAGPADLADLAAGAPAGAGPVFLPYVAPGEQGALWDPALSGALVGLTLRDTRADLARALQTGLVLESARCVGLLTELASQDGRVPGEIRVGGAAVSAGFAQDLADSTGRVVRLCADEPAQSAVGAAMLAARAVGAAILDPPPGGVVLAPRAAAADGWEERFAEHERARLALGHLGGRTGAGGPFTGGESGEGL